MSYTVTTSVNPSGLGTVTGGGTYSSGDNVTLTATENAGSKFLNWLLKGYTQLEYIESSGSQYINSLCYPKDKFKAVIDVVFNATTHDKYLFGSQETNHYFDFVCSSGNFGMQVGNQLGYSTTAIIAGTRYTIEEYVENSGTTYLKVDGTTVKTLSVTTMALSSMPMYIFALNNGSVYGNISAKLYSMKFYDGDTLVRDYIPVIRHSDGAIGLLDKVNLKFYGNSGSGTFIGSGGIGEENITFEDNPLSFTIGNDLSIEADFKKVLSKKYIIGA